VRCGKESAEDREGRRENGEWQRESRFGESGPEGGARADSVSERNGGSRTGFAAGVGQSGNQGEKSSFDGFGRRPYTANMSSSYGAPRVGFDWRGFITPAVKLLVLICTGVFLVQTLVWMFESPATHDVTLWINLHFGLVPLGPFPGLRIWQPFTYIFLHGGLWHLLINMLMLWMFGRELELVWGKNRFLNYFFICGVGAGIITILVKVTPMLWHVRPSDVPTIGASGAIFGILIANAILFPDRRIWLFPLPLTIPMRPFVAVMAAIEFFATLGETGDRVSHLCHLGGMLIGWIYLRRGSFLYRVRNEVADWKYERNKKRFQVYMKKQKDEPPSRPDHWVN
jgi:membrane associated rhomboid family serine protease